GSNIELVQVVVLDYSRLVLSRISSSDPDCLEYNGDPVSTMGNCYHDDCDCGCINCAANC
ncbi:13714_t:CDS:2, partial [Dentiscutata heterogama]